MLARSPHLGKLGKGGSNCNAYQISPHLFQRAIPQTLILYGRSPAGTQIRNKKLSRPEPEVVLTHCADILHPLQRAGGGKPLGIGRMKWLNNWHSARLSIVSESTQTPLCGCGRCHVQCRQSTHKFGDPYPIGLKNFKFSNGHPFRCPCTAAWTSTGAVGN